MRPNKRPKAAAAAVAVVSLVAMLALAVAASSNHNHQGGAPAIVHTASSPSHISSSSSSSSSSSTATGTSSSGAIIAHAVCMLLAWGLMWPVATLLDFVPNAVVPSTALYVLACGVSLIGLACSVAHVQTTSHHGPHFFGSAHAVIGLVLTLSVLVHACGVLCGRSYTLRSNALFVSLHTVCSDALSPLSLFLIFTGTALAQWGLLAALVGALPCALSALLRCFLFPLPPSAVALHAATAAAGDGAFSPFRGRSAEFAQFHDADAPALHGDDDLGLQFDDAMESGLAKTGEDVDVFLELS